MGNSSLYQKRMMVAAISACFPTVALGAGVARVDFAVGNVTAVAPDGRSRPLTRGAEIEVGETVATQQGRAQLRFSDGAYMSLQPQTEFKVEEFKYANSGKAEESDSIVMNLLKGGLRTITGLIGRANRNNYRLRTDVATIGIRGTEFSVKYTNSIEVFCADGSILVQNEGGTLQLNSGQGGYVANNDTAPQQTENRPVLPPESPTEQQLQEQQQQAEEPVNPIQEAVPPITQPVQTAVLSGTFTGHVGIASYELENNTFQPGPHVVESTSVTFDTGLASYQFDTGEGIITIGRGTAQLDAAGNDGTIAWGRWIGGQVSFDGSPLDLFEGPAHYVVGLPATEIPQSGTGTYQMMGYSASCMWGSCTSVAVGAHTLTVTFGARAGVSIDNMPITITGGAAGTYVVSGSQGVGANGVFTPGSYTISGGSGCNSFYAAGFLSGSGAVRAGLAWHGWVYDADFQNYSEIRGANAYQKQ